MAQSDAVATVDAVLALYRDGGNECYDEVVAQTQPGWQDAVRLRRWDDRAKEVGCRTRSLDDYRSLLLGLVLR